MTRGILCSLALGVGGCGGGDSGAISEGNAAQGVRTALASTETAATSRQCNASSIPGDGVVPYPTDTAAYAVKDGLYERPDKEITLVGTNDGVANSYTEPFTGALGGRYLLFHSNSHVTLTGKGYVLMRWEYAYFNRGGVITPAIAPLLTATAGTFVKRVAGASRFMPDPDVDGVPGKTGLWRPGTQNYIPLTIVGSPTAVPTGWQNEYYYIDGTVTFTNRENGLDYNVGLTPVSAAQFRADIANTRVGSAPNVQRPPLLLDPYGGSSKPSSPVLLTAAVVSDSRVTLSWVDCATTETGYFVEYSYAGDFGDPGMTKSYALGELYAYAGSYPAGTTNAAVAALMPSTRYLMRVKAYNPAGDSAYSNTVDFTTPAALPLPLPYMQSDVTATALTTPGTASASNGNFAVRGATGDLSGTSDSFTFVHRPMTGDGTVTARILGLSYVASGSKAGLMLRDGTGATAAYVMTKYQPASGVGTQRRGGTGGSTAQQGADSASAGKPWWLRVSRRGNVFTMQSSPDGSVWTTLSTTTIPMSATLQAGLVAASVSDRVATATYDNVSLTQP